MGNSWLADIVGGGVKVDIWSDVVCPWCYIGKRRFEAALAEFDGEVDVEYHSFELSPGTHAEVPGRHVDWLAAHLRTDDATAEAMLARVRDLAASVGLRFDHDHMQTTNTRLAHELLHLAKHNRVQPDMTERLMSAYFTEGRHIGRIDELADLAEQVGLDRAAVTEALESGSLAAAVQEDIDLAARLGIRAVPTYIINGTHAVSGAQSTEAFVSALREAAAG